MTEMVQARRFAEKKEEQHDLFSSLLDANEDESDGQARLTDSELLGMGFIQRIPKRVLIIFDQEISSYFCWRVCNV